MYCIICRSKLNEIYKQTTPLLQFGWECLNCQLDWPLAEHKDNQNWAVRHIRALEKQLAELINKLESKGVI